MTEKPKIKISMIRIAILIVLLFIAFRLNQLVIKFVPNAKSKSIKEIVNHYLFWDDR